MIVGLIVWYAIGFISLNVGQYLFEQKITVGGLGIATFLGIFGPMATLMAYTTLSKHGKLPKDITIFGGKK